MTSQPAHVHHHSGEVRVGPEPAHPGRPARRFPDAVRVLLAAVAMFLMAFSPLLVLVVPGAREWLNSSGVVVGVLGSIAVSAVSLLSAVLLVWLLMRFVDRRPMRETGWAWNARALPMLLLGTAIAVVIVVAVGLLLDAGGLLRDEPRAMDAWWITVPVVLGRAFLLQGIPEELIWRGYVLQTLRVRPEVAVFVSAAGFAVLHLASQGGQQNMVERVLYLALPFGFALLAGVLVLITGSLWVACGIHGGVHTGALAASYLGIGDGPVAWVALGAVHTVVALVLLRRHRVRTAAAPVREEPVPHR